MWPASARRIPALGRSRASGAGSSIRAPCQGTGTAGRRCYKCENEGCADETVPRHFRLGGILLKPKPEFAAADVLVNGSEVFTSAHALAEAYAKLSGDPRLKLHSTDVAQMVEDLATTVTVRA